MYNDVQCMYEGVCPPFVVLGSYWVDKLFAVTIYCGIVGFGMQRKIYIYIHNYIYIYIQIEIR